MIAVSNYGGFIISTGEIPPSSDANKLFPVFTSGSNCTEIQYVQWYGGDSNEAIQMFLIPPTITINGTTSPQDHAGSIAITPPQFMYGGALDFNEPGTFGATEASRGALSMPQFIVPPFYQIAIAQNTANSAVWSCTVGGFELNA